MRRATSNRAAVASTARVARRSSVSCGSRIAATGRRASGVSSPAARGCASSTTRSRCARPDASRSARSGAHARRRLGARQRRGAAAPHRSRRGARRRRARRARRPVDRRTRPRCDARGGGKRGGEAGDLSRAGGHHAPRWRGRADALWAHAWRARGAAWRNPILVPGPLGRRYSSGVFDVRGTTLIVSRGLGGIELPLRSYAPPDVRIVDVVARPR